MFDKPKNRASLYRKHKRLIASLNFLIENKVIPRKALPRCKARIDDLYVVWWEELKLVQPKSLRGRGRPRSAERHQMSTVCKKPGCNNPPVKNQAYCCREHAPYGLYDLAGGLAWT
jgi:hypothetical protein